MKLLLLKILNKIGVLKYLVLKIKVKIYESNFYIPVINKIGLKNIITTEPWMHVLLKKLTSISKEGTFVDVGVNIGQTLLKLKSVDKTIQYVGFEPNPTAVFYANELVKANDFKNVEIIPIGLNNQTELLSLNIYNNTEADPSASIIPEFRPAQKIINKLYIPVYNINDINNIKSIIANTSILKIDVEGAELEVLQSLESTIELSHPIILIEILPVYKSDNSFRINRQEKIEELTRKWNYTIFRMNKTKENNKSITFEKIETIGIHSDINKSDYIFVPNNKLEIFNHQFNDGFGI